MAILRDYVNDPRLTYSKFYKFGSHHKGTYFELPNGPEERFGGKAKDTLDLNWMSIEDLVKNEDHFTADQQNRISAILNPDLHRGTIGCKNVLNSLLGSVAEAKNYAKVCMCCTKAQYSQTSLQFVSCDNWRYCEKCASRKRQRYFKQYYYYFENADERVYHFTITLDKKITYQTENYQVVSEAWNKLNSYVDFMLKNKVITGALIFEEMTVDQLHPTIVVNPHIHVIVTSQYDLEVAKGVQDVKVHVKEVTDKQQFRNLLNYLPKAIDLSEIYISSWTKENAREVNQNLREVMTGFRELFTDRWHTRCIGRFHGKNKRTIVVSPEDYKRYRSLDPDAKKKTRKQAGHNSNKKIKCVKVTKPKKKMLPINTQPINKEEKPKSSGFGKFLGLSALGGLGALGAYAYGRNGNNFLTGAANSVHDNVVNPVFQRAQPIAQKLFPSYDASVRNQYANQVSDRLNLGEFGGYANHALQQKPSGLQGTPFEGLNEDRFSAVGNKIQNSSLLGGALLGSATAPMLSKGTGYLGVNSFLRNSAPKLHSLGAGAVKFSPKLLGPLSGLASIGDASELSNWLVDKSGLQGTQGEVAKGIGTATGMAAAGAGALAGAKIPGPPLVKLLGSIIGGAGLPIVNAIRKAMNQGEFMDQGLQGRQSALLDMLPEAIQARDNYGNSNLLDAWRAQAGDLNQLAEVASNPELRQQILSLQ